MSIELKRKGRESVESLLRRFTERIRRSRVLINAKRRRFYEPPKTKFQLRQRAKRRSEIQAEREHLRKIGKLPIEELRGSKKFYSRKKA